MGKSSSEGSPLTNATKPTRANVCCSILVNLTMMIFFAIYAFKNPDEEECYIVRSADPPRGSDHEVVGEDNLNMTLRLKIMFVIGFIICLINLAYAICGFLYFMYEVKSMLRLVSVLVGASGILTLGWMIYASVVVFAEDSDLCEEYTPKSYKFAFVWLVLVYCAMGLFCCCSCMFICVVSSNKQKKNKKQNKG